MSDNGRYGADENLSLRELEAAKTDDYSELLLLEDMESLREQMDEAGVDNIEQARLWLNGPASDRQRGIPDAAERANLEAIIEMMDDLEVSTRADLDKRIKDMHESGDWD